MEEHDLHEVKDRAAEHLLELPGVHGVAIGGRLRGGRPTGEVTIMVFVEHKLPLAQIPPEQHIPAEVEGIPTDVVELPVPTILQGLPGIAEGTTDVDEGQHRPLRGGISIGAVNGPGYGTLGCICTMAEDETRVFAITNHHVVLKRCEDTPDERQVGQPFGRSSFTNSCHDIVGMLVDSQCSETLDVALIGLNGGIQYLAEIEGEVDTDRLVTGVRPPIKSAEADSQSIQVKKRGRQTGLTGGVVLAIGYTGEATDKDKKFHRKYTNGIAISANQAPSDPKLRVFADHGDSGSVVRDLSGKVIGILFSKADAVGLAFPIQDAIAAFASPDMPAGRRLTLEVATATGLGHVLTVPMMMAADEVATPVPLSVADAERLEEQLRASRQGELYADLYRRHREEAAALVHSHRRVSVVWHRSGAAELFQLLWRAFAGHEERVPTEIQGRPIRACLEELAAAFERYGSALLGADVRRVLPSLPDIAGLTDREIVERLKGADHDAFPAPAT